MGDTDSFFDFQEFSAFHDVDIKCNIFSTFCMCKVNGD